jgi:succinate dehydrogenase/fumarate reductase flavoprotein subunit
VIFGSGGFTHNTEFVRNFLRGPIFGGCAVPTNTGDIIDIAGALGAELGNMNSAWFAQIPFEQAMQFASVPNDIWLPYGDSMIQVNRFGRRVVNEKMVYNERTQVHFYWDATEREFTNKVLFMVYDAGVANNPTNWPFRYPVPLPGTQSPLVISGSTWTELAANINGRLASHAAALGDFRLAPSWATTMQETVARFNGFAESGKDVEFRRGETPIQVAWHGPPREGAKANPTMYPFTASGPYYAIIVAGGTLDTKGGPKINARSQILNTAGRAIPGLYGAGNCIAGPAGKSYWAAGGTLGPALTFGWIAGENAAREAVKADK